MITIVPIIMNMGMMGIRLDPGYGSVTRNENVLSAVWCGFSVVA